MEPIVKIQDFVFDNLKPNSLQIGERLLPIYPSVDLAEVVAAVTGDGHIDLIDGKQSKKVILYSSDYANCT